MALKGSKMKSLGWNPGKPRFENNPLLPELLFWKTISCGASETIFRIKKNNQHLADNANIGNSLNENSKLTTETDNRIKTILIKNRKKPQRYRLTIKRDILLFWLAAIIKIQQTPIHPNNLKSIYMKQKKILEIPRYHSHCLSLWLLS